MENTLNERSTDPYTQLKHYQTLLQKYLTALDKLTPAATNTSNESSSNNLEASEMKEIHSTEVLNQLPSKLRGSADRIMRALSKHPDILRWNDRGNIIFKNQLVPSSNITDLLSDVLVKRKNFHPQGQNSFLHALKEMNIPESLITNPLRRTDIQRMKDISYSALGPPALSPPPSPDHWDTGLNMFQIGNVKNSKVGKRVRTRSGGSHNSRSRSESVRRTRNTKKISDADWIHY